MQSCYLPSTPSRTTQQYSSPCHLTASETALWMILAMTRLHSPLKRAHNSQFWLRNTDLTLQHLCITLPIWVFYCCSMISKHHWWASGTLMDLSQIIIPATTHQNNGGLGHIVYPVIMHQSNGQDSCLLLDLIQIIPPAIICLSNGWDNWHLCSTTHHLFWCPWSTNLVALYLD